MDCQDTSMDSRDHLFISYAWEDGELAEWLVLKLTAEGYRVWCDRIKLLGGESFPRDIEHAIREKTFRMVALLSRSSLEKPNPLKERTLALSIGKSRDVDFLIPLNVNLQPEELPWMLSDLTYIPFGDSWAHGFVALLKKLNAINTPKPLANGQQVVSDWFAARDGAAVRQERLWSNLIPITRLPEKIHQYAISGATDPKTIKADWPCCEQGPLLVWAFGPPDVGSGKVQRIQSVAWRDTRVRDGLRTQDIVTNLLQQLLRKHCTAKGMVTDLNRGDLFFPSGLLTNNRIPFVRYDGRKTYVTAVGERTFYSSGQRERLRYHLSPGFRIFLTRFDTPVVQITIRVHLTDLEGSPIDPRKIPSRRKAICKNWWNYELT